jgi:hypothetical protein
MAMRNSKVLSVLFVTLAATMLSACSVASLIDIPNENPTAFFTASNSFGPSPLSVTFNGVTSTDSDGTIVQYEWDYQGDGVFDTTAATPGTTFVYIGLPGAGFDPVLRVTDNEGATGTYTQHITLE